MATTLRTRPDFQIDRFPDGTIAAAEGTDSAGNSLTLSLERKRQDNASTANLRLLLIALCSCSALARYLRSPSWFLTNLRQGIFDWALAPTFRATNKITWSSLRVRPQAPPPVCHNNSSVPTTCVPTAALLT